MKKRERKTPALRASFASPGATVQTQPGDFFLTVKHTTLFRLLSWGERRRFKDDDKKYARWNHTGLIVGTNGEIIEATHKGVVKSNISEYKSRDYMIVTPHFDNNVDIDQMIQFAEWALGKEYGILTIISLSLWALVGGKFDISLDGTIICSGLVARALERAGYIFDRDPSRVTPADLAQKFDVYVR
jgi:uncharacterized protein YycO